MPAVNEDSSEPINNEQSKNENSIIARQYERLFSQVVGDEDGDGDANQDCDGDSESNADRDDQDQKATMVKK